MKVVKQNQKKTKTYKLPAHKVYIYIIYLMLFIFRILLFKIKRITSAQQLILIIILWHQ